MWAMGYNCLMIPVAAGVFYPFIRRQVGTGGAAGGTAHAGRMQPGWRHVQARRSPCSIQPPTPCPPNTHTPCSCRRGLRAPAWPFHLSRWSAPPCCCGSTGGRALCCETCSSSTPSTDRGRGALRGGAAALSDASLHGTTDMFCVFPSRVYTLQQCATVMNVSPPTHHPHLKLHRCCCPGVCSAAQRRVHISLSRQCVSLHQHFERGGGGHQALPPLAPPAAQWFKMCYTEGGGARGPR